MKINIYFYGLAAALLLVSPVGIFAAEKPVQPAADAKKAIEVKLSAEDQHVIALMDLLQKMDMLKDLDLIAAGEVKK